MATKRNTRTTPAASESKPPTSPRKPASAKPAAGKPAKPASTSKPKPAAKPAPLGPSTMTRVQLTGPEWVKLRKRSKSTGVTLARIIGDAVRVVGKSEGWL